MKITSLFPFQDLTSPCRALGLSSPARLQTVTIPKPPSRQSMITSFDSEIAALNQALASAQVLPRDKLPRKNLCRFDPSPRDSLPRKKPCLSRSHARVSLTYCVYRVGRTAGQQKHCHAHWQSLLATEQTSLNAATALMVRWPLKYEES